ncbi:tripartite tricarboxylate transporter TctB family protein [Rhizobium sp. 2MFCol3.1]|uniref:tripartite tricarboxylate transporter TctB family protein n=1 Tax=Rhizobium sp. 2MFCol3.1 TaxID=1246459 RepID=UPI00035E1934|nr:tripartite tricarboxylate transporter TctB family protein [Rhizobium sp. 2MFCol3.1]
MHIKRLHMEIITAGCLAIVGVLGATGALELGVSWGDSGPKPGYFPFYVGLIVIAASIGCIIQALLKAKSSEQRETFLESEQTMRLLSFFVPMAIYVVVTIFLGFYVATALYLFYVAWRQGKYKPYVALLIGIAFSVALYLVFETAFQVPLHKGPIEDMLGIY